MTTDTHDATADAREVASADDPDFKLAQALSRTVDAGIDDLQREHVHLLAFARKVIVSAWEADIDGADVQEWAEKYKLTVPHVATEEDAQTIECEPGDTIYKFSEWMQAAFKGTGLEEVT